MLILETINLEYLIFLFVILSINITILYFKIDISNYLKIIDHPDDVRKIHKEKTPLIGGVCFYISIIPTILFNYFYDFLSIKQLIITFLLFSIFFITGLIDDIKPLKPKIRSIVIIASLLLILPFEANFIVKELNFISTSRQLNLGYFSVLFTVFCVFALYNAINFADGVNGSVISVAIYWTFLLFFKNPSFIYLNAVLILSLLFFFNIKGKIFLGNSGASLISIFFSLSIIFEYNLNNKIFADEIIFLLFFLGLDMIRVTIERFLKKKKIYSADKSHFHHYLYLIKTKYIWIYILSLTILPYLLFLFINNIFVTLVISSATYFIILLIIKNIKNAIK